MISPRSNLELTRSSGVLALSRLLRTPMLCAALAGPPTQSLQHSSLVPRHLGARFAILCQLIPVLLLALRYPGCVLEFWGEL